MLNYDELLLLGAIAGLTIFLGLPMALLQSVSPRKKGFLNALSMGILVFLISDVLANAWAPTKLAVTSAYTGTGSPSDAALDLLALFGGLGLGLLGLASYEQRYIRRVTLALKSVRPGLGGMTYVSGYDHRKPLGIRIDLCAVPLACCRCSGLCHAFDVQRRATTVQ